MTINFLGVSGFGNFTYLSLEEDWSTFKPDL